MAFIVKKIIIIVNKIKFGEGIESMDHYEKLLLFNTIMLYEAVER